MRIGSLSFIAVMIFAVGCSSGSEDGWEPSKSDNPSEVLDKARVDRIAGRYEAALEKHVWYHENALKHEPSLTGVRLSFALADWRTLANRYPPALEKMKQFRERAESLVKTNRDDFDAFMEFDALNQNLKEEHRTVSLFKWLDANDPSLAQSVYHVAQNSLVTAQEFDLCSKYIDADRQYDWIAKSFRLNQEWAKERPDPDEYIESDIKLFTYKVAQLVAILANVGRSEEASEIADRALLEWNSETFDGQLRDAQNGVAPARIY